MGRVNQPGPITAKLAKGHAVAGDRGGRGLAEGAKSTAITIQRKDRTGKETRFKVNLKDIIKGKKMDMRLQEGDTVIVPESFW